MAKSWFMLSKHVFPKRIKVISLWIIHLSNLWFQRIFVWFYVGIMDNVLSLMETYFIIYVSIVITWWLSRLIQMLSMIWIEKWYFRDRCMIKVKFQKLYTGPVNQGCIHTHVLLVKVTSIMCSMVFLIQGVITMVLTHSIGAKIVIWSCQRILMTFPCVISHYRVVFLIHCISPFFKFFSFFITWRFYNIHYMRH